MEKQKIYLKSNIDKKTGYGVDKTGRPKMEYGTFTSYSDENGNLYLIGKEGIFSKEKFYAFLKSIRHKGDVKSFVIQFNSKNSNYKQDRYEPKWSKDLWGKAGWAPVDVQIKEGY